MNDRADIIGFRDGSPIRRHPDSTSGASVSRYINGPADRMVADLDLVRSLVRSWGDYDEGSAEQALAITRSQQVIDNLFLSASEVISPPCQESSRAQTTNR